MSTYIAMLIKRLIKKYYSIVNNNKIWWESGLDVFKSSSNIIVGDYSIVDSSSKIGKYTYIGRNCKLTKVEIGNYCSIGDNVTIGPGEHDIYASTLHRVGYSDAYEQLTIKPCKIGHDVWIGVDAVILRGVTVGNGAVIGANSVVTKDVKPYSVVVGSPAKEIKQRLTDSHIVRLEKDKWWLKNFTDAKEYHKKYLQ
ncbi:CatB-related O-acetyltransferase [Vibrio harveyi]|uniref:CatB-related O-acetyltransferase n=1 Tax=Vibrio harveyi TaxID=669 RepID=UPI0037362A33